ncbi:secreted protein [Melampsora americana]|nr:secreted protein [Melampsora americana]
MKFALITLVASLGASAVHGSTTGSRSLLTRGDNMARETLNVISGNGTNGSADADPSLNNTSLPPGTLKGTSMGNSTKLPILSSHGNGSVNGSTNIPPPPMGPKDLPPLSPNATTSEKIANLEAKIADHKQKLERAESKLAKLKVCSHCS